ncbi:YsnF/AvaK domain-containing protein [Corallococcus macrosporus]|uniref:YsnF/AvaK domain-containing protein n=2 Tax=Corallococcus macrosporus TaxID=35 RepID=A0ABS3DI16_9BACT|nr:YsnF/AvaK domain-containing protein [Corallococcus macrosporus]
MIKRNDIKEGMTVRSIDGEKLGKVFAVSEGEFHIEKGMFFPKDYLVRYSEVSDIRDGEIILNHGREALSSLSDSGGVMAGRGGGAGVGPGALGATAATATGSNVGGIGAGVGTGARTAGIQDRDLRTDMRASDLQGKERIANDDVTLRTHHEELGVTKHQRAAGEAQVRKVVVEEMKTVEVPLRHEEVEVVRRVAKDPVPGDMAAFREETIRIPLSAEEAELTKRTYTDEEISIHKRDIEEQERLQGSVRREEVDGVTVVRTDADVDEERRRTGYNANADIDPLKRE